MDTVNIPIGVNKLKKWNFHSAKIKFSLRFFVARERGGVFKRCNSSLDYGAGAQSPGGG